MLPDKIRRIIICGHTVDFRKQWNGLLAECRKLGFNPYEGDVMLFVKRDKRGIRVICGDDKGLMIFSRRFEGGCLQHVFGSQKSITRSELALWFAGAKYTIERKVKPWR